MADAFHLDFPAHPFVRGGHAQTLTGLYLPWHAPPHAAEAHRVQLDDGDHIVLHDDCPQQWSPRDSVVLLLAGLVGCHGSGYMQRISAKLHARGIRVFRMDMRGVGAAAGWARCPAHAGRTEDAAVAISTIAVLCPQAPLTIVGFSMGGNIALATLADAADHPIGNLLRGIAVAPPADLAGCCQALRQGIMKAYDRYLARLLVKAWTRTGGRIGNEMPSSIYEFDQLVTAPMSGFRDAEDYYARASSGPRLREIQLMTRILAARDDPIVPLDTIQRFSRSAAVSLFTTSSGGHLGFITTRRHASDRRWLDRQIVDWVCDSQWVDDGDGTPLTSSRVVPLR